MAKVHIEDAVTVRASRAAVWAALQDPTVHATWHPFVTRIEGAHTLEAVRVCHAEVGGKTGRTEERCTAFVPEREIRWAIEKDSTGFSRMAGDWTAGFSLHENGAGTRLVAHSTFEPRGWMVRLMMPFIRVRFHGVQRAILEAARRHVETGR